MAEQLYIEDLKPGLARELRRVISVDDIERFGELSGDRNPIHFDEEYASSTRFDGVIAHGMLSAGLISTVIGMHLPGKGAIYLEQTLRFLAPVRPGDEVIVTCTVNEVFAEKRRVSIDCVCVVGETAVVKGQALVAVPSRKH